MSALSPRISRFLIAAGLGLVIALVVSIATEGSPSAVVVRGDFPAFYTLAYLAERGEGHLLYDLATQGQVQNAVWPSLSDTMLPAAYPAYLAFFLRPLALLDANTARVCWICLMGLCVMGAVVSLTRGVPTLRGMGWQLLVALLLFGPLFVGVVGGQLVGFSLLCYALLLVLSKRKTLQSEVLAGIVAGMWMVKPHFGLSAGAIFLFERRWVALGTWVGVTLVLWILGAAVAGTNWVGDWLAFARQFSEIDLITNAYQMSGFVAFAYSVLSSLGTGTAEASSLWDLLSLGVALFVPGALFFVARRYDAHRKSFSVSTLCLGPLLALFAPVVNFYDLSLILVPLIALLQPEKRGDVWCVVGVLLASQCEGLVKGTTIPGVSFALAVGMSILCWRAIRRYISVSTLS